MNDVHVEIVAAFIAQEASIEEREAEPQARDFIEFLAEHGIHLVGPELEDSPL